MEREQVRKASSKVMKDRTEIHRDLSRQASLVPCDQIVSTDCLSPLTLVMVTPFRAVDRADGGVIYLRFQRGTHSWLKQFDPAWLDTAKTVGTAKV